MLLILSIVLSTFLGFLLLSTMGPIYGGIMAFGIVAGCLFRGVYLLNEINQHILKNPVKKHQIQDYVKKTE
ncbi:hypothetical protein [Bacillus litorisediminis]|uniref:hypothetical protein n=1 Tax=Bacillus litorisediminis TaxID=2922713 RepID=UPI001FADEEA6|nr:hypothetical protein [Bacillus litorisediminis]